MRLVRMPVILTLVLGCSFGLLAALSTISSHNKHSPARAYEKWFRGPVPPGITELQVAGHWWKRGRAAWFRFKATPAALESVGVAFNPEPFDRKALLAFKPKWDLALAEHDPHNRLRWRDLYTVRRPETSVRLLYNDAQMWVDRDTRTVFVYCFGN